MHESPDKDRDGPHDPVARALLEQHLRDCQDFRKDVKDMFKELRFAIDRLQGRWHRVLLSLIALLFGALFAMVGYLWTLK